MRNQNEKSCYVQRSPYSTDCENYDTIVSERPSNMLLFACFSRSCAISNLQFTLGFHFQSSSLSSRQDIITKQTPEPASNFIIM